MRKLLPFVLAGVLSIAVAGPVGAQASCEIGRGGAAGLVAAVVQANVCDVYVLNDSVNNLLRNADIHVLENILNNSPILSFNDVELTRVISDNNITITVLGGPVLIFE
jgi:hypothetical protein